MNKIMITDVDVKGNLIECRVKAEGLVSKAFKKDEFCFTFFSNLLLDTVPISIAVLPALGTLIPLAWLFDASLEVPECDSDFLNCLPDVKKGYIEMYPNLEFKGSLHVKNIRENKLEATSGSLSLYSGGLDSHDTVIRHADEHPDLLVLRGADISNQEKDDAGWKEMLSQVDSFANELQSKRISVETNFREALNYRFLNKWTTEEAHVDGTYWFSFQHGIAFLLHTAPIAWVNQYKRIYIASSYTKSDEGKVCCASDPSIDDYVRFFGIKIEHDGYQYTRNAKLANVTTWCKENNKKVFLRVCHSHSSGIMKDGKNCCRCEKCYRTILGLYALKENPNDYGFDCGDDFNMFAAEIHERAPKLVRLFNLRYLPIIEKMRENYTEDEIPENLKWFYSFSLTEDSEYFKWVDRRVVSEHERAMANRIEARRNERRISELKAKNTELKAKNTELKAKNTELKAKNTELKAELNKTFGKRIRRLVKKYKR